MRHNFRVGLQSQKEIAKSILLKGCILANVFCRKGSVNPAFKVCLDNYN